MNGVLLGLTVALLMLLSAPALAAEEPTIKEVVANLDIVWTLIAAFLVFIMQAGFAMVETGFTRAKNAGNIMMKNLMDFCVGSLAYWAVGFALMFGTGTALVGLSGWFLRGGEGTFAALDWSSTNLYTKFVFQLVFAATAATIVSGAMAERTKFVAYLIYSFFVSLIIYPISGHWTWGGGWLGSLGFLDFAGSTVVHGVGGWVALAGTLLLGPRIGKYNQDGSPNAIPGHNIPLAALGVFLLWFGWYGFNPGSTMAAVGDIAKIAATTTLAASAGAVAAMLTAWAKFGKPDIGMTLNGALAGLVGITAGCAFVEPWASVVIGALAGVVVVLAVFFFDRIHVDDPVGAISVHGVSGALGTLAVGIFATDGGLLYGGGLRLLGVQALGVISVFLWAFSTGYLLFALLKATVGLRVSAEEELEGLDIPEHGSPAYPNFWTSTHRASEGNGQAPAPQAVPAPGGVPAR